MQEKLQGTLLCTYMPYIKDKVQQTFVVMALISFDLSALLYCNLQGVIHYMYKEQDSVTHLHLARESFKLDYVGTKD